jgi:DHA1 family bicyclomycin/chloramphenicol resistance-like MFS transporter
MVQLKNQTLGTSNKQKAFPSLVEFVIILSMMMALTALSIDAMLPALPVIAGDLGVASPNGRQLVITMIFLGSAIGQLFFGPLSDSKGRKKAIAAGYCLYIIGSLVCLFSANFPMLLTGRVLQGLGTSTSMSVMLALVRDQFQGRKMAQVMSFSMVVFILVPMIAPTLGQFIISLSSWRTLFGVFMIFAVIAITWFSIRVPETLAQKDRAPFSIKRISWALKEILKIRSTVGFTLAGGLLRGIFQGYLISAQQIFQEQYALGERFPAVFATIALSLGLAAITNASLVIRYGMRRLVNLALRIQIILAAGFLVITLVLKGHPPLEGLIAFLMVFFFCQGILNGNMNTLAMQPLAHLAGIGAAVIGSFATFTGMALGFLIGQSYQGTVTPLVGGMALLAISAAFSAHWAQTNYEEPVEE